MRLLSISLLTIFLMASCSEADIEEMQSDIETESEMGTEVIDQSPQIDRATAVLSPTEGNEVAGVVVFTRTEQGVRVQATVAGLESETRHGFHVHQYGDCRAPDGTSAGGHYNPTGAEHGGPDDDERHMGDMGNIPADEEGRASVDFIDSHLEMSGSNSIIGHAVIVHGGPDDFESQPSGDAGPRLACGVIGIANPDFVVEEEEE